MLKLFKILFSITAIAFGIYGLVTQDFKFQGAMLLFMGLTFLIVGLQEFKKNKKANGWGCVAVFILSLYVSIDSKIVSLNLR